LRIKRGRFLLVVNIGRGEGTIEVKKKKEKGVQTTTPILYTGIGEEELRRT